MMIQATTEGDPMTVPASDTVDELQPHRMYPAAPLEVYLREAVETAPWAGGPSLTLPATPNLTYELIEWHIPPGGLDPRTDRVLARIRTRPHAPSMLVPVRALHRHGSDAAIPYPSGINYDGWPGIPAEPWGRVIRAELDAATHV